MTAPSHITEPNMEAQLAALTPEQEEQALAALLARRSQREQEQLATAVRERNAREAAQREETTRRNIAEKAAEAEQLRIEADAQRRRDADEARELERAAASVAVPLNAANDAVRAALDVLRREIPVMLAESEKWEQLALRGSRLYQGGTNLAFPAAAIVLQGHQKHLMEQLRIAALAASAECIGP